MSKRLQTAAQLRAGGKTAFGYRGIESGPNRRSPQTKTGAEVVMLDGGKRQKASGTVRDDRRNFTILAWMIRRHLDNVSRFTPHVATGNDKLDAVLLKLLRWHAKPRQFDATARHGRDEWMRMFEACKVISGDAGGLKVKGGKLQGIEGDRIAIPGGSNGTFKPKSSSITYSDEGLAFAKDGTRSHFCLCKRSGSKGDQLEFEREVPATDMIFDGYWPERFDANRGVSPIMTALDEGADVRETREWLVIKAKASALFGLKFKREGSDSIMPSQGEEETTAPTTEAESYTQQLQNAIKSRGLINLDLDPGDDVSEIESKTPNAQVIEFTHDLIRSILLAVDIPYTFYDSLTASFSARIADRNEYEEACEWKREKNIGVLDEIYAWLLPIWRDADLFQFGTILKKAGITVEELLATLLWVPAGKPWLDRTGEMSGHILALAAGVTSVPRICAMYGEDANEIAREQKKYLETCGIPLLYAQGGQVAVQEIMKGQVNGNGSKEDSPKQ